MHPSALRRRGRRLRRPLLVVTAALAASVVLTAIAPDAAVATPGIAAPRAVAPAQIRISSPAQHLASGHRAVIRGAVRGPAAAGRPLVVQQRLHGARVWRAAVPTTTDRSGRFALRTNALRHSTDFRVQLGDGGAAATTTITVTTSLTVTATSPLTPTAGDAVVLAGTSAGALAGARIFLQQDAGGVWTDVSSSTVYADGTFNVQAVATAGGARDYRVLVPSAPGRERAVSAPVSFTVYAWYRLSDLAAIAAADPADAALRHEDAPVGGSWLEQSLGAALQPGATGAVAFDTAGRCTTFAATVALADGADASAWGRWRLLADDDLAVDTAAGAGSAVPVSAAITGAETLELRSFVSGSGADAVWGDARVLCAGRP